MSEFQAPTGFTKALSVFGLALLLAACSGPSGGTRPTIESFTAVPATITQGETSTLAWTVTGDAPITLGIDQGVGNVTGQTGREVRPATTTSYTLTATNSAGEASATVTVMVGTPQVCTDPVAIPDTNLEQAVRDALGKPSGEISCAELESLTEIEARDQNISNVEGLQYAANLVSLNLDINEISDVSPLSDLNKLEWLNLNNNQVSDLTPFANLTSLRGLYICCSNPYTDISLLASLTNLEELDIGGHGLGDISVLAGLDKLERVWVWGNNLDDADMNVFEGKDLRLLNICCNSITNLSFLTNHPNLEELNVSENSIADISALVANSGIADGDTVDISNNLLDLTDPDVQADIQTLVDRGVDLTYDSQRAGAGPSATLAPGTYNLAVTDDPTTVFLVLFDGTSLPDAIDLTITGPDGWNGGEPLIFSRNSETLLDDGASDVVTGIPAVSGTYELTLTAGTKTYRDTATLDAGSLLSAPQNVTVTNYSATEVSGGWDAVPDALSYQAFIREDYTKFDSPAFRRLNVEGTSATITGLDLPPGTYVLEVVAWPIDFTTDARKRNPGTFNMSYNRSEPFSID